jgi:predicted RecA/RadA family phage recombinase
MRKACFLLLLTVATLGCGYSSKNGTVAATAPTITQLSPSSMTAGGPAFTLTVSGANFASGAVVYWNGGTVTTTFVSSSKLTAAIPAANIANAGTVLVHVTNPGGTGIYMNQAGQSSATVDFTVMP